MKSYESEELKCGPPDRSSELKGLSGADELSGVQTICSKCKCASYSGAAGSGGGVVSSLGGTWAL